MELTQKESPGETVASGKNFRLDCRGRKLGEWVGGNAVWYRLNSGESWVPACYVHTQQLVAPC
ncbi:hypothetical protein [Streptomyces sp. NPDC048650]|uniref:hypothetical protein n=1 Tax=Streptomyces sp. NPDC048650 TaxID=3365583 RepID=UPI00371B6FDC